MKIIRIFIWKLSVFGGEIFNIFEWACFRNDGQQDTAWVGVRWDGTGVGEGREWGGGQPVLFVWNFTLNSDAAPNCKYMFGTHGGPLPHLWNLIEKHNLKHSIFVFRTLRKHAYSNILKILPSRNEKFQIKNSDIFHISAQNIHCGNR